MWKDLLGTMPVKNTSKGSRNRQRETSENDVDQVSTKGEQVGQKIEQQEPQIVVKP